MANIVETEATGRVANGMHGSSPSTIDILKQSNRKEIKEYIIMLIVNLANFLLVFIKGVAAYAASSFSIGTSAIESFGDVFVSILLLVQLYLDKRVQKANYPRGRSSESTSNLTAAVVMMALASVNFIQSIDAVITGTFRPDFSFAHNIVIIVNIGVKIFLFMICFIEREKNQIRVLMRDQLTDVLTNTIALAAICAAQYWHKQCDFVGAFIIFGLILRNWAPIVADSWLKLQGVKGDKEFNKRVSQMIAKHHNLFKTLEGFVTYHIGNKAVVEIYCQVENELRAEIFSKIQGDEIHAVYLLPIEESQDVKLNTVELEEEKAETDRLLQTA